jgi:hypothetical protein
MTRRLACTLPAIVCCARYARGGAVDGILKQLEQRLVILGRGLRVIDFHGNDLGGLHLPENCLGEPAVAPDGACLAWIPRRGAGARLSMSPVDLLSVGINNQLTRVSCQEWMPVDIAVASGCDKVALSGVQRLKGGRGLVVFRSGTDIDLGESMRSVGSELEKLRFSSDGRRLAISGADVVAVLDVDSGNIVFKGPGRFASISPDGLTLAYIEGFRFIIRHLETGKTKSTAIGWRTYGVGAWSPDGRFVLAGAWVGWRLQRSLVIVDCTSGDYLEVERLSEGDFGSRYVWIRRELAERFIPVGSRSVL